MNSYSKSILSNLEWNERRELVMNMLHSKKKQRKYSQEILQAIRERLIGKGLFPEDSGKAHICEIYEEIGYGFQSKMHKNRFHDVLSTLAKGKAAKLLDEYDSVVVLFAISKHKHAWLRDIKDWRPNSRNSVRLISHLIRFLFAKYPVPSFMDDAFYANDAQMIEWFIHIGKGGNMRTAKNLPVPLTKKMAHHFLLSPSKYGINEALRYGQVLGLGGDPKLARYIIASRLGRGFGNEEFWKTYIHLLINTPDLDVQQIDPLIDYIRYQKFVSSRIFQGRGEIILVDPPQADFSLKGRTIKSLIRAMKQWHSDLAKQRTSMGANWQPHDIPDGKWIQNEGRDDQKIYRIQQLLSGRELLEEGKSLSHCVGSYTSVCRNGRSSIWSLNVEILFRKKNLLTIEVDRKKNAIVQVRGKCNSYAKQEHMKIISDWAKANGLKASKWL